MTNWIMSANGKYFDHEKAFAEQGFIDWKQTRHYQEGDIIYIYCTKPDSKIRYVTKVVKINMHENEISNQTSYSKVQINPAKKYCRLELVSVIEDDRADFTHLQEYGLKYVPQSPARIDEGMINMLEKIWRGDK